MRETWNRWGRGKEGMGEGEGNRRGGEKQGTGRGEETGETGEFGGSRPFLCSLLV